MNSSESENVFCFVVFFITDENACIPPTILNAIDNDNSNGWYENGHKIRIKCAIGYEHKNFSATAECTNGTWSSLPVCESKSVRCVSQVTYKNIFTVTRIISLSKSETHNIHLDTFSFSCLFIFTEQFLACGEPPEIPHAVIIHEGYQDVFGADSVLQYECEEGFTVEGVDTKKTIICISGNWSTASPCRK